MANRRARCIQCGRPMLVPWEAYISIMCSGCQGSPPIRPNYRLVDYPPGPGYARPDQSYYYPQPRPVRPPPPPPSPPGPGYARPDQSYYYPQPRPVRPPPPPPSPYGNKRAVLFGISYGKRVNRIKGSVNDAHCMKYFLTDKLGFPSDSIRLLTDDLEERNPLRLPTRHNMRMAMRWLVEGCRPGDSLVFYFSGHGSREVDRNMDEVDGYDEAICPVDYEHEGKILDDEINATIVRPLPRGAKLHALVDTCFSGTVLDLPFMCRMNRKGYYGWEDHRNPRAAYKGTRGGLALCISACDDDGNAADTSAFSGMESAGALTYSFIRAMQDEPKLSYGRLLNAMRSTIREAKEGHCGPDDQEFGMDTWLQGSEELAMSKMLYNSINEDGKMLISCGEYSQRGWPRKVDN